MANIYKVPIDGEKLRAEINRRGMTLTEASANMGYSVGYISQTIKAGTIQRAGLNLLEKLFSISYDDIKPTATAPAVMETRPEQMRITPEDYTAAAIAANLAEIAAALNELVKIRQNENEEREVF